MGNVAHEAKGDETRENTEALIREARAHAARAIVALTDLERGVNTGHPDKYKWIDRARLALGVVRDDLDVIRDNLRRDGGR